MTDDRIRRVSLGTNLKWSQLCFQTDSCPKCPNTWTGCSRVNSTVQALLGKVRGSGVGGEGGEGRVGFSFTLWSPQLEEGWQLSVDHKPGTESSTFKINNSPKYKPQNISYHQRKSEGEKEMRGKKSNPPHSASERPLELGRSSLLLR